MSEPETDTTGPAVTIPQADRLEKVRELVAYWAGPAEGVAAARRALALAKRDYGYYAQAARVLGFLESADRTSAGVTPLGHMLLQSEPGSPVEREVLLRAIASAPVLAPICAFLHGDESLAREELKARIGKLEGVSGETVGRRAGAMRAWRTYLLEHSPLAPATAPQLGLFDAISIDAVDAKWPPPERFPHNRSGKQVSEIVYADLLGSERALIVAGYASLAELLRLVGGIKDRPSRVRVILGAEPFPTSRRRFVLGRNTFSDEVRDYWLEQGISLRLSGAIIRAKQLLAEGRLDVRLQHGSQELHAKIFIGDGAATLGSSNFTDPGLRHKREANARFRRLSGDRKRYDELHDLAEIYWAGGADFNAALQTLLDALLQRVSWRHALARACAELLEGRWAAERYPLPDNWQELTPLWPCQRQGIAQALWILENVGSVLLADATGSGKTRMGAHLVGAIRRHLLAHGRATSADPFISCPPDAVLEKWRDELSNCGMTAIMPFSHGFLSNTASPENERAGRAIRIAPVVVVDEAHNFLNPASNRTRAILGNVADHKVLLTATPISRRPADLLGIVDQLGADNFDDEALELLSSLLGRRTRLTSELSDTEREELRLQIARFTVRRTRAMLNAAVDREPGSYLNEDGKPCRYPRMDSRSYGCDEPEAYRRVAAEIRELASNLRGLLFLRTALELPSYLAEEGYDEQQFVKMRLRGAKGLARHHVMASFRSSRAALFEHIHGTAEAVRQFDLREVSKSASGNVIDDIEESGEEVPAHKVTCELPPWLTDPAEHRMAAREESSLYRQIAERVRGLPPAREEAKARLLERLAGEHEAVLAFDSRPITLADLHARVQLGSDTDVVIATGGDVAGRRRVLGRLGRTSRRGRVVALCSDAMAEGFNLQGASAVVHLDMPSVVRIAEQRTGRVDRMDSPHEAIEAYWPKDPPEIALRGDERLVAYNQFIDSVLGSNLILPTDEPAPLDDPNRVVTANDFLEELGREDREWDEDAFSPVRDLVEGDDRLVPREIYDEVRISQARIVSAVSVVRSSRPWAFLAVGGTERTAPRWVYIDSPSARPETSLHGVASRLRHHLGVGTEDAEFDERATHLLTAFVDHLQACERALLPRIKQRALDQMQAIIRAYQEDTPPSDERRHAALRDLARLTEPAQEFDLASVASCWLDAIRPTRYQWLMQRRPRRKGFMTLRVLDSELRREPLSTDALRAAFVHLQGHRPLAERIVAVILGVP